MLIYFVSFLWKKAMAIQSQRLFSSYIDKTNEENGKGNILVTHLPKD